MSGYNVDSLLDGIERCKKNIITFEDAIDKERNTIKEYYYMIDTIQRKEREHKAGMRNIEIERED